MERPSWVAGVVFSVVVFVVALVGIVWGTWYRQASRLLQTCWTTLEDGTQVPRYVVGTEVSVYGPCEGAQELVWPQDRLPLAVAAVSDLEHFEADYPVIQAAVADINRQVKFELFQFVGDGLGVDASVLVYHGEKVETEEDLGPGEGGAALRGYAIHYQADGRQLHSDIVLGVSGLDGNVNVAESVAILTHLFLHAVGLAHDNEPSSLMYPLGKWGEAIPTKITGQDRVLLRHLYRIPRKPWGVTTFALPVFVAIPK